ncbi:conserved hypothetical protein [Gammaproteobacteria bacterium]
MEDLNEERVVNISMKLDSILARPDIWPLLEEINIGIDDEVCCSFIVHAHRCVLISSSVFDPDSDMVAIVRHAIELYFQLKISPEDPVLAGLMAARCSAVFKEINFPKWIGIFPTWHSLMAADTAPDLAELQALWPELALHQPGAPQTVLSTTGTQLAALWPFLGPTEYLIAKGGDTRLQIDPKTGLNAYGCSPRPRPWAITFASSTASSISERGYAAAEKARRRMINDAINGGIEYSQTKEMERIHQAISEYYGLSKEVRILVVPSGTDGELLALGVALSGDLSRPLTNLLVGPEESGSGVPLAAAGHHFSTMTARGVAVAKGAVIDGVPVNLEVLSVPIRTNDGTFRSITEITTECVASAEDAVARGRRVLFHIIDQSKTGLLAPNIAGPIWSCDRDKIDMVVDASQARLAASSVRGYVEHGIMVLLTGSKFFTGPPFAGVLLVPPPIADRLDDLQTWPTGFADYFGDIRPAGRIPAIGSFKEDVNFGLALRWQAALAEMEAFAAIDKEVVFRILLRFGSRIEAAIKANPDLYWHETILLNRPDFPESWDRLPTIFTFSVWRPGDQARPRRLFDIPETRQIYIWLNSDLSDFLPASSSDAERRLAAQYAHIGQPVALVTKLGTFSGAFRLSAGARLISGEPSHLHLDLDARTEREINDALIVLEKVSLIVRYFEQIRSINPLSRFQ